MPFVPQLAVPQAELQTAAEAEAAARAQSGIASEVVPADRQTRMGRTRACARLGAVEATPCGLIHNASGNLLLQASCAAPEAYRESRTRDL